MKKWLQDHLPWAAPGDSIPIMLVDGLMVPVWIVIGWVNELIGRKP